MSIVDDDGRLFGRVNVFDALVVLGLLVAVVAAGVVVLDPLGDESREEGEPTTRYATVHLGEQTSATASDITEGDAVASPEAGGSDQAITITDTYVGPDPGNNASVVVRVRIDGTAVETDESGAQTFEYDDDPLRRGDDLSIDTAEYDVRGEILAMGTSGEMLSTGSESVLVRSDVPASIGAHVDDGDRYRVGNRTVATVDQAVVAAGGSEANETALLGLTVRTIRHSGGTYFGHKELRVGRDLTVDTRQYSLMGEITKWGEEAVPSEPTTRSAVVKVADVPPEIADGIEAGIAERRDGTAIASVESVESEPATVILTSDDGNIYERDHPTNRDLYLTLDLRVRSTDQGLEFRLEPLREGSTIRLDFETTAVEGIVTDIDP